MNKIKEWMSEWINEWNETKEWMNKTNWMNEWKRLFKNFLFYYYLNGYYMNLFPHSSAH